jgi:hypothetical protein
VKGGSSFARRFACLPEEQKAGNTGFIYRRNFPAVGVGCAEFEKFTSDPPGDIIDLNLER